MKKGDSQMASTLRRQPDGVDVEAGDVIEPGEHAGQIADTIVVAVEETAWVDLVDDAAAPPVLADNSHTAKPLLFVMTPPL